MQVALTTTGRKSGKPHEVLLNGFADGDRLIVVGSYAGRDLDPDWVANLRTTPKVGVRVGSRSGQYLAHEVDGSERERLWELVTDGYPPYATYQQRTERLIPLFSLEPFDAN